MEREVQIISPRPKPKFLFNGSKILPTQKRVAAYCRVSSDRDEQLNSFDNQVDEWKKRLEQDPSVVLVGIYADEGISGTSEEGRLEFQRLINDARAGKIDKIVTKSISRFARNIQTSINIARELKAIGVEIYFDNEHISTLDPSSEVMFTINAIMAQEEARHISENVKWTFNKKKKEGIPLVSSNLLGYRRDPENPKNLIIIPEEAQIVKEIFELYTNEVGTNEIGRILEKKGYLTRRGKTKWYNSTIEGVITNEKYCGDLILQKSVTIDFLNHKRVKNDGLEEQVYIKNNHEPIVSREIWDKAQIIYAKNRDRFKGENKDSRKYASQYPLSGMLVCLNCGNTYKRRHWTQGYAEPRIMFQCNNYINGYLVNKCHSQAISEDILLKATAEVINRVYLEKGKALHTLMKNIESQINIEGTEDQVNELKRKQETIEDEIDEIIKKKQSADEVERILLEKQYRERIVAYHDLENQINDLLNKNRDAELAKHRLLNMGKSIKGEKLTSETLTKPIVQTCIESIIVVDKHNIVFVLPNNEKANYELIKERRAKLVEHTPVLEGNITYPRRFRPEHLHYKVVLM